MACEGVCPTNAILKHSAWEWLSNLYSLFFYYLFIEWDKDYNS
jgi:hypothetical protein